FLGKTHCMEPVSTRITSSSSATTIDLSARTGLPSFLCKTRSARESSRPNTAACADHLTDPSGHRAVTQCCTYRLGFPAADSTNVSAAFNSPLLHGTPQVTPRLFAGT